MSTQSIGKIESRPGSSPFFTGLALFSMFFGAGNLIFPLLVGRSAGVETPSALVGLALSAVAFPFLGLMAMVFYQGDLRLFLAKLGKWPAFVLLFILSMAQGPVGSMPRLITLMHASTKSVFPTLSLFTFSILMGGILFLLTFRPKKMVDLLGLILTPLLLLSLLVLLGVGFLHPSVASAATHDSWTHFMEGLKGGYQTMDLIASLLFASLIMPPLAAGTEALSSVEANRVIKGRMKQASLIAAALLMLSYIGLCWLSSHYSVKVGPHNPEDLLSAISLYLLGPEGSLVAGAAIFLACLTTAISLAAVFSSFLRREIFKDKISPNGALVITLAVTAAMANIGFTGIMRLWGPILDVLYPFLIVLCLWKLWKKD